MTQRPPLPTLRCIRSFFTVLAVAALCLLGAQVRATAGDASLEPAAQVGSPTRSVDIWLLDYAQRLSRQTPEAALPLLTDLARGSLEDDVRQRAAVLILDCITRSPGAALEGKGATLRYVYVTAEDEQVRQRALLFLLALQVDELPEGAQGAFLTAILPQVLDSARKHQLPASVTLAQAVLESGWGRSRLAREHNNLFGVKAGASQAAVTMATREHQDGEFLRIRSRFRSFDGMDQSIEHHAELLAGDRRYAAARDVWSDWRSFLAKLAPTYATDPAYAKNIARLVERYELDRWDGLVQAGAVHDSAG